MNERSSDKMPRGQALLELPQFNKGTAFTWDERIAHGLLGLLPAHEETLEEQVARAHRAYQAKHSDLERHIYLRQLQDFNETLFYRLIMDYPAEMIPIIYTPTVGDACKRFSEIYRKPRGLFIAYPERDYVEQIIANVHRDDIDAIVVTDSEAILGIGDQGVGGMGIPIGKLALYTSLGGVDPNRCLPMLLDVGTNNETLLEDPLYIGWSNERITGSDYDDFIDQVLTAIRARWPDALVQFEDFGSRNAARILERYRDEMCCFNDDIQGTAAVTLGSVLAACRQSGQSLKDAVVTIVGAGSAGCGIAEQLAAALVAEGLSEDEARNRFYLIDRDGLVREHLDSITPRQQPFSRSASELKDWSGTFDLAETIAIAKPNILIGVSGQPGLFTEAMVKDITAAHRRPIIFPLSNPTDRAEARPEDVIRWSDGCAMVACGSPFQPVIHGSIAHIIAQCNNAYAFPGIGLGVIAVRARRVTDEMFMRVARTIGDAAPDTDTKGAALLPHLAEIRPLSRSIAIAVGRCAVEEGVTDVASVDDVEALVDAAIWTPDYRNMKI